RTGFPGGGLIGAMVAVMLFKALKGADITLPSNVKLAVEILIGITVGPMNYPGMLLEHKRLAGPILVSSSMLIVLGFGIAIIYARLGLLDSFTGLPGQQTLRTVRNDRAVHINRRTHADGHGLPIHAHSAGDFNSPVFAQAVQLHDAIAHPAEHRPGHAHLYAGSPLRGWVKPKYAWNLPHRGRIIHQTRPARCVATLCGKQQRGCGCRRGRLG
ncbi:hypothetical protein DQK91_22140, partial [Oceanidesulfovibrio marinus]